MEAFAQSHTAGRWQRQCSSQDACHQAALIASMFLSPYRRTSIMTPAMGPHYSPALTLAVRIVMAAGVELLLPDPAPGSLHAFHPHCPTPKSRAGVDTSLEEALLSTL